MSGQTSVIIGELPDKDEPDYTLDDEEKLVRAVNRVNFWFDYFDVNIQNGRDDIYFLYQSQWDPQLEGLRREANKPCLQINTTYSIVTAILGQVRKNTPTFKVQAIVDNHNPKVQIDQDELDVREGYMRQIYFENKANQLFQTAAHSSVCRGYGAIMVYTDHENPYSHTLKPIIKVFNEPTNVFFDPYAEGASKEDGDYCGWLENYKIPEFKEEFKNSKAVREKKTPQSFGSNQLDMKYRTLWMGEDYISVCNYFVREKFPITVAHLSDGRSMELSQAEAAIEEHNALRRHTRRLEKGMSLVSRMNEFDKLKIESTNEGTDERIMHYKMIFDEILEACEWPSKLLPVVYLDGDSHWLDGQQYTKSFHRTAKDAQKIQNILMSDAIDNILNSHKSLFMGTPENFKGYERQWRNPSASQGALVATRDSTGQLPQVVPPPQISSAYGELMAESQSAIQRTLGYFAANQGQESNESSGLAVTNRVKQGNLGSFVYYDNIERAQDQVGKIILSLFPAICDSARDIMIRSKEGDQKYISINQKTPYGTKNDFTKTNFTVDVTVDSPYEVQKQENLMQLQQLLQTLGTSDPMLSTLLSDLYASNLDLENTTQIVDRIRQHVLGKSNQEILSEEMGLPAPPQSNQPNPAMMQFQLEQQKMQLDQQKLQQGQQKLAIDEKKLQLESQKLDNERLEMHSDRQINALKAHVDSSKTLAEIERTKIDSRTAIETAHISAQAARQKQKSVHAE